jgi:hypothetical protein
MSTDFNIAPTRYSPTVCFTEADRLLDISGRSFPENTAGFYAKVESQIKQIDPSKDLKIRFYFEYLNSSSIISILKLIKHFEEKGTAIIREWHYDAGDEEIENVGKDIQRLVHAEVVFCETV